MNRKLSTIVFASMTLVFLSVRANAQEPEKGRLSGSFETNSMYYLPDSELPNYTVPSDRIGSNNYLKIDYTQGKLSAGIEYEMYAPALQGFDSGLDKGKLTAKYASWTDKNFNVTVGNFYEQFGSGMILRSYEDRALGFNNSLEGARIGYNYQNIFNVRGLVARPRLLMDYADIWVRGVDATIAISEAADWNNHYLAVGGSFVNRYEALIRTMDFDDINPSPNTNLWAARVAYEYSGGLFFRGEYVEKGKEVVVGLIDYELRSGKGALAELGYNGNGLGIAAAFRRVENMTLRMIFEDPSGANRHQFQSLNNVMNYVPSLTRQYTYMLANLQPHATLDEITQGVGEQGAQVDMFYNFKRGSYMGGRYGMKVRLNGSLLYATQKGNNDKYNILYSDASLDVEKQWTKQFKTIFLYSLQMYDPAKIGLDDNLYTDHIFVTDMMYKFNPRTSLRWELQYLYSNDGDKSWAAALVEANFAPQWSVFASDMYNINNDNRDARTHYYSVGVSYTLSRTRIALSFARNREGLVCSGGVCREMPAYSGVNLSFTTSF